jgi:hypothetical protein
MIELCIPVADPVIKKRGGDPERENNICTTTTWIHIVTFST